jgi:GR25 family glycosyltransferase involved in LPS biosynthesis
MEFILILILILIIFYILNSNHNQPKLNEKFINNSKQKTTEIYVKPTFIIYTQNLGLLIAKSIGYMLNKLKLKYNIVLEITDEDVKLNTDKPNEIYIILFPQTLKIFPDVNKYIIYQLEQYKQSTWINDEYKKKIENSLFTLEYSLENYNNFDPIYKKKIFYFPIPIINIEYDNLDTIYKYDILFVGAPNNRRNNIIRELKKKYNVLFLAKTYNNDLYDLMDQTKIILNLHYYKNAILETTRLNEALFNNKLIISELPDENDVFNKKFYENNIIFIDEIKDDLTNINNLFEKLDFYLNNKNYNEILSKNSDFLNKIFEYSFFYLYNSLLKNNLIENNTNVFNDFKNIDNIIKDKLKFIKNIVVITANFSNIDDNKYDFNNFVNKEYFDWYYFTNSNSKIEGWNVINNNYFDKEDIKINDNDLKMQFYKTQHNNIDLLKKYSYIIWIDPNIIIDNKNFVNDIINLIEEKNDKELFIFENYEHDSLNENQINNLELSSTTKIQLLNLLNNYIKIGYPNNKLYETGFYIYKNNQNNKKLFDDWWFETKNNDLQHNLLFSFAINKNMNNKLYILNENNFIKGKIDGSINKNKLIGYINSHNNINIKNNNIIKKLILNNKLDEINNMNIDYKKINYIDGIIWINSDKDIENKNYMEKILSNLDILNYKIDGINSNNNELLDMFTNVNYERKLNNSEIANTLSHIKAINYLDNLNGNYFLICEDNISFNNLILIDKDLKTIILECPKFDILILNKNYSNYTNGKYVKWENYYKPLQNDYISSSAAYIISREGINKFVKFAKYIDSYFKLDKKNNLDVSDIYIYKYLDTYVYKYNFITTKNINNKTDKIIYDKIIDDKNNLFQLNIILKDFFDYEIKNLF